MTSKPAIGRPFPKGQSGNPSGRKKGNPELKALAQEYTAEAIERLAFWMRSEEPKASVQAANSLLDRAWGKPVQALSDPEGNALAAPVINLTYGIPQPSPAPEAG